MSTVIVDIESRPDPKLVSLFTESIKADSRLKDPVKIAEDIREKTEEAQKLMALDADYNTIVCVGVKEIGKPGIIYTLKEYADWLALPLNPEDKQWKERSVSTMNASRKMITFNGKNFDIPTIIKCGIREGLDLPYATFIKAMDKYRGDNHIDLAEKLSMVFGKYKSLDQYLKIYLGIKKETDGDDFFRNATDEQIKEHCLQDLEFTEQLYKKFEPLFV